MKKLLFILPLLFMGLFGCSDDEEQIRPIPIQACISIDLVDEDGNTLLDENSDNFVVGEDIYIIYKGVRYGVGEKVENADCFRGLAYEPFHAFNDMFHANRPDSYVFGCPRLVIGRWNYGKHYDETVIFCYNGKETTLRYFGKAENSKVTVDGVESESDITLRW